MGLQNILRGLAASEVCFLREEPSTGLWRAGLSLGSLHTLERGGKEEEDSFIEGSLCDGPCALHVILFKPQSPTIWVN